MQPWWRPTVDRSWRHGRRVPRAALGEPCGRTRSSAATMAPAILVSSHCNRIVPGHSSRWVRASCIDGNRSPAGNVTADWGPNSLCADRKRLSNMLWSRWSPPVAAMTWSSTPSSSVSTRESPVAMTNFSRPRSADKMPLPHVGRSLSIQDMLNSPCLPAGLHSCHMLTKRRSMHSHQREAFRVKAGSGVPGFSSVPA